MTGVNRSYFSKINLVVINCIKSKLTIESNLKFLIDNTSSSKTCLSPKFHSVTTYYQLQTNFAVEK